MVGNSVPKHHFHEILHINEYDVYIKLFARYIFLHHFYLDPYAITHSKTCGYLLIDKLLLNSNLRTITFYLVKFFTTPMSFILRLNRK